MSVSAERACAGSLTRTRVADLGDLITCRLCGGYLVDATSVATCGHTFCRSCIVQYTSLHRECPLCGASNASKDHDDDDSNDAMTAVMPVLIADTTLQTLVYKLVPQLYHNEMYARRVFCRKLHSQTDTGRVSVTSHHTAPVFSEEELVHVRLTIRVPHTSTVSDAIRETVRPDSHVTRDPCVGEACAEMVRFVLCAACVPLSSLNKLVAHKLSMTGDIKVLMCHGGERLTADYSLADVCYIFHYNHGDTLNLTCNVLQSALDTHDQRESDLLNESVVDETVPKNLQKSLNEQAEMKCKSDSVSVTDHKKKGFTGVEAASVSPSQSNERQNVEGTLVSRPTRVIAASKSTTSRRNTTGRKRKRQSTGSASPRNKTSRVTTSSTLQASSTTSRSLAVVTTTTSQAHISPNFSRLLAHSYRNARASCASLGINNGCKNSTASSISASARATVTDRNSSPKCVSVLRESNSASRTGVLATNPLECSLLNANETGAPRPSMLHCSKMVSDVRRVATVTDKLRDKCTPVSSRTVVSEAVVVPSTSLATTSASVAVSSVENDVVRCSSLSSALSENNSSCTPVNTSAHVVLKFWKTVTNSRVLYTTTPSCLTRPSTVCNSTTRHRSKSAARSHSGIYGRRSLHNRSKSVDSHSFSMRAHDDLSESGTCFNQMTSTDTDAANQRQQFFPCKTHTKGERKIKTHRRRASAAPKLSCTETESLQNSVSKSNIQQNGCELEDISAKKLHSDLSSPHCASTVEDSEVDRSPLSTVEKILERLDSFEPQDSCCIGAADSCVQCKVLPSDASPMVSISTSCSETMTSSSADMITSNTVSRQPTPISSDISLISVNGVCSETSEELKTQSTTCSERQIVSGRTGAAVDGDSFVNSTPQGSFEEQSGSNKQRLVKNSDYSNSGASLYSHCQMPAKCTIKDKNGCVSSPTTSCASTNSNVFITSASSVLTVATTTVNTMVSTAATTSTSTAATNITESIGDSGSIQPCESSCLKSGIAGASSPCASSSFGTFCHDRRSISDCTEEQHGDMAAKVGSCGGSVEAGMSNSSPLCTALDSHKDRLCERPVEAGHLSNATLNTGTVGNSRFVSVKQQAAAVSVKQLATDGVVEQLGSSLRNRAERSMLCVTATPPHIHDLAKSTSQHNASSPIAADSNVQALAAVNAKMSVDSRRPTRLCEVTSIKTSDDKPERHSHEVHNQSVVGHSNVVTTPFSRPVECRGASKRKLGAHAPRKHVSSHSIEPLNKSVSSVSPRSAAEMRVEDTVKNGITKSQVEYELPIKIPRYNRRQVSPRRATGGCSDNSLPTAVSSKAVTLTSGSQAPLDLSMSQWKCANSQPISLSDQSAASRGGAKTQTTTITAETAAPASVRRQSTLSNEPVSQSAVITTNRAKTTNLPVVVGDRLADFDDKRRLDGMQCRPVVPKIAALSTPVSLSARPAFPATTACNQATSWSCLQSPYSTRPALLPLPSLMPPLAGTQELFLRNLLALQQLTAAAAGSLNPACLLSPPVPQSSVSVRPSPTAGDGCARGGLVGGGVPLCPSPALLSSVATPTSASFAATRANQSRRRCQVAPQLTVAQRRLLAQHYQQQQQRMRLPPLITDLAPPLAACAKKTSPLAGCTAPMVQSPPPPASSAARLRRVSRQDVEAAAEHVTGSTLH